MNVFKLLFASRSVILMFLPPSNKNCVNQSPSPLIKVKIGIDTMWTFQPVSQQHGCVLIKPYRMFKMKKINMESWSHCNNKPPDCVSDGFGRALTETNLYWFCFQSWDLSNINIHCDLFILKGKILLLG